LYLFQYRESEQFRPELADIIDKSRDTDIVRYYFGENESDKPSTNFYLVVIPGILCHPGWMWDWTE
jgi:hypothetical protein